MAGKLSNPRDLFVQLLGELLYVERRLAGEVLQSLADEVHDPGLRDALVAHLTQTSEHVDRIETAFRRIEVAPSANLVQAFESAKAQHDELAPMVTDRRLADIFHAQAALHTEHWELAAYRTVLELAPNGVDELLRPSQDEEAAAAGLVADAIERLSHGP